MSSVPGPAEAGGAGASGRQVWPAAMALALNALVWGLSWWPFRQLHDVGLHPLWATALIYGFALLCLLLVKPFSWHGLRQQPALWLLLLAAGLTNVGFNWAVTVGDVLRVVLLFYLMPAWSVLLAWPLLGERPSVAALLRLTLALSGVAVVLKTADVAWPWPTSLADWLALGAGAAFALTNILLRRLRHIPDEQRAFAMFGGGGLLALLATVLGGSIGMVALPPAPAWGWMIVLLGLSLAFLAANLGLQYGAARLAASTTALILLTELVFASVSAVALGAAELSARTLLGGALIVLAALWAAGAD